MGLHVCHILEKCDKVVLKFDRGNKRQADHEDSEKNDGARTLPNFKMVYRDTVKKKKKKRFETGTKMDWLDEE